MARRGRARKCRRKKQWKTWSQGRIVYTRCVFLVCSMSFLSIFLAVSGVVILLSALDIARQERFNALHFLVFIAIGGGLILFTFFPNFLTSLGNLFWLQRGADILVYSAIIFLTYFVLLLLRKVESQDERLTRLIREIALLHSDHENKK